MGWALGVTEGLALGGNVGMGEVGNEVGLGVEATPYSASSTIARHISKTFM